MNGLRGSGAQPQGRQHRALDLRGEQAGGHSVARDVAKQQGAGAVGKCQGVVEVSGEQPLGGDQVGVHGGAPRAFAGRDQEPAQTHHGLALLLQRLAVPP